MGASPRIRSISFVAPGPELPADGKAVAVGLEDGSVSTFAVAAPEAPGRRLAAGEDFYCGPPELFVKSLDEENVGEAVEAMSGDIGGFWLRYYNFPPKRRRA